MDYHNAKLGVRFGSIKLLFYGAGAGLPIK